MATSTWNTYSSAWRCFQAFAVQHDVGCILHAEPIKREGVFSNYVTYCAIHLGLSYVTIKTHLAAIRFFFIQGATSSDPFLFPNGQPFLKLQYTLKGIKKSHSSCRNRRLPITITMLKQFLFLLNKGLFGSYIDVMLKSVILLAFFAFLRCGEFTSLSTTFNPEVGLSRADISIPQNPNSQAMRLTLKASKTDPFRQGVTLQVFPTFNELCPVAAMQAFLSIRDATVGSSPQAPLFQLPNLLPLSRTQFTSYFDSLLTILHLPVASIRPHSFRIGAATAAASAGVPDHLIKVLGRWKSDCYQRYIHTDPSLISNAQTSMASIRTMLTSASTFS